MTALNALNVYKPETLDLAFKLRRKRFIIEKLHLPPGKQTIIQFIANRTFFFIHIFEKFSYRNPG